jgi:hypothetical protein
MKSVHDSSEDGYGYLAYDEYPSAEALLADAKKGRENFVKKFDWAEYAGVSGRMKGDTYVYHVNYFPGESVEDDHWDVKVSYGDIICDARTYEFTSKCRYEDAKAFILSGGKRIAAGNKFPPKSAKERGAEAKAARLKQERLFRISDAKERKARGLNRSGKVYRRAVYVIVIGVISYLLYFYVIG